MSARIAELRLNSEPEAWTAAGFSVEGGRMRVGSVEIVLGEETAWTLSGVDGSDFDGLPTKLVETALSPASLASHRNGALSVDHVVAFTGDLERTIAAFERSGVGCRRIREVGEPPEQLRQAFFRFGEVVCEVVQVPPEQAGAGGATRFWGVTITVADLDEAAELLGDRLGSIRDAVQPGRRIATVRREAGLGLPVALITPESPRE